MVDETNAQVDLLESAVLGSTADSTTLATLMNTQTVDISIDVAASAIIHTLAVILSCLSTSNPQNKASDKSTSPRPGLDAFNSRINDIIRSANNSAVYLKFANRRVRRVNICIRCTF